MNQEVLLGVEFHAYSHQALELMAETNTILVIRRAKGSDMLVQIPLPIRTQTLWWYHIWLGICIRCPWLFEQVDVSFNRITPFLDADMTRR